MCSVGISLQNQSQRQSIMAEKQDSVDAISSKISDLDINDQAENDGASEEVKSKYPTATATSPRETAAETKPGTEEETISLFCWNIKGTARAPEREQVTKATFESIVDEDQPDVIFLQEMTVKLKTAYKRYFPIEVTDYGYWYSEESASRYNSILFKEEKFARVETFPFVKDASDLMDLKKKFYEKLRGDEKKIKMFVDGKGTVEKVLEEMGIRERDKKPAHDTLCDEVLKECSAAKKADEFGRSILLRYQAHGDAEAAPLRSPLELLEKRAAMVVVKVKSQKDFYLLVISLHSPYKKTRPGSVQHALLLFDFLDKFELVSDIPLPDMCVLIAGDFNTDITEEPCLKPYLAKYDIPDYKLQPLREGVQKGSKKIDFILSRNFSTKHSASVEDVKVSPMKLPESNGKYPIKEQDITNHSPLSARVAVSPTKSAKARATPDRAPGSGVKVKLENRFDAK